MLRMMQDKVLVESVEEADVSPGGIIIPDAAKEKPTQARVLEVGPGVWQNGVFVETTVKVGDLVVIPKWTGDEITVDGKKRLFLVEGDILAVVVESD